MTPVHLEMRRRGLRPDILALVLAPLGAGVVLLSQIVAGVPLGALFQFEAALVVFGGTLGALFVSYAPGDLWTAVRLGGATFLRERDDSDALAATMVGLAARAHRKGLVAIDADLDGIADPFLREGLEHAIDESSGDVLRSLLRAECAARTADEEAPARVFEAAAGYAPTLGILGAVLGLIDVMRHLRAPHALGDGMAVAFVATIYGVGLANLVLLPMAGRIRERAAKSARRREMMTHGIAAIHQRMPPRALAHALRAFGAIAAGETMNIRGVRLPASAEGFGEAGHGALGARRQPDHPGRRRPA